MNAVIQHNSELPSLVKSRTVSESNCPTIFTDVYREDINIAIWRRYLSSELQCSVSALLKANPTLQTTATITPQNVSDTLKKAAVFNDDTVLLIEDIGELVNMFCCLLDLKEAGLRLTVLNRAMCPRFHVDRIPCRLVTAYQGKGTEWLPHNKVNREKLGVSSQGLSDEDLGLFQNKNDIQNINSGDVALLKGELWERNKNAGLVHRSPSVLQDENRFLLTLDAIY